MITVEEICTDLKGISSPDNVDTVKTKELKKPLLRTSTPNKSKNIESMRQYSLSVCINCIHFQVKIPTKRISVYFVTDVDPLINMLIIL